MVRDSEQDVVDYAVREIEARGGVARPIIYRGRKGCADYLVGFPVNRLFLIEFKRPKGGKIGIHQSIDAEQWFAIGVMKEFLFAREMVDCFLRRVCGR